MGKHFLIFFMIKNCLVVILAGGNSIRMGKNKLYLDFNGYSFLDYNILKFKSFGFKKIVISGNVKNYLSIKDKDTKLIGPLSGIYSVISNEISFYYKRVLFLPIDMPFLSKNLIFNMFNNYDYFDVVFYENYNFPILFDLSKGIRKKILFFLNKYNNNFSISNFLSKLVFLRKKNFFFKKKYFFNINYKNDFFFK